jgi:hypothetical protein
MSSIIDTINKHARTLLTSSNGRITLFFALVVTAVLVIALQKSQHYSVGVQAGVGVAGFVLALALAGWAGYYRPDDLDGRFVSGAVSGIQQSSSAMMARIRAMRQ